MKYFLAAALVLMVGCSKALEKDDSEGELYFGSFSKAAEEDCPYRILAYSLSTLKYAGCATFYGTRSVDVDGQGNFQACLQPYGLDENGLPDPGVEPITFENLAGSWKNGSHSVGGTSYSNYYGFIALSPGLPVTPHADYPSAMKIVVEPNRKIDGNDAGAFYANSFQSIGKTYSLMQFTPTNSVLSDNRSRIIINFCKGSAKIEGTQTDLVNDFQIIGNAVSLEGMGNDAQMWYYPVTRQIEIPSDAATPMILPMTDRRAENLTVRDELGNDNYLYYSTELYVPSCILINRGKAEILSYLSRKYGYTISDDVTSLIVDGTTVLRLRGQLQQGERQFGVSFGLTNLVDELMPMHTYVFNLILKSNYIEVTLHLYGHNVHSWSEVGDLDYEFGEPRHINLGTISLGADSHDWSGVSDEYAFGD